MTNDQQSAEFRRYLGLKLLTAVWFVFAIFTYLYLVLATWQAWWPYDALGIDPNDALDIWAFSYASGGLGATLYAARGFYQAAGPDSQTNRSYVYDPNWTWWYFLRPLLGGPAGLIAYVAGRILLTPVDAPPPATESARLAYIGIAFAGGFAFTQLMDWLNSWASGRFRAGNRSGS